MEHRNQPETVREEKSTIITENEMLLWKDIFKHNLNFH